MDSEMIENMIYDMTAIDGWARAKTKDKIHCPAVINRM